MSKKVKIGNIYVGGGEKIAVQSMCDIKTSKADEVVKEINELEAIGCDIIRVSVKDKDDAAALPFIKKRIGIPLVADIHFDYKLALAAIDGGADKIRINPGNIGSDEKVGEVARAIKQANIAVRVGSNTGSVERKYLEKYGKNEISLGESALEKVAILEKYGVENIVVSAKASSVPLMVKTYRYLAEKTDYPLHLGVTEAGTPTMGLLKSAIGIGGLLCEGIGDTMRVSLTADPVEEVYAAKRILQACGIRRSGVNLVSCPTCGRTAYDMIPIAEELERRLADCKKNITVAVMGCVVNGPGEAHEADYGIAGGKDCGLLFRRGEILGKYPADKLADALVDLILSEK